jgi:WD40 repeat protein
MRVGFTLILVFLGLTLQGQNCFKYDVAMDKGSKFLAVKNYDSALVQFQVAQIAARECGKPTDLPAKQLEKVFKGLQDQRDEAKAQRDLAVSTQREAEVQKAIANKRTKEAIASRELALAQKEAFRLIIIAQRKADENPTVALRIAEAALSKYPDSIIYAGAQQIYGRHSFYKTLIKDPQCGFRPVAFSRDGKKIIATCGSGGIRLWDSEGRFLKDFSGHASDVTDLAFSPDSQQFLSVAMDSTARVWNVSTAQSMPVKLKTGYIWSGAFSPDGKTFLTGSDDSSVQLWETNGDLKWESKALKGSIDFVSYSDDGTQIFGRTRGDDRMQTNACLWNVDGSLRDTFRNVFAGIFVQNKLKIITLDSTKGFTVWDKESGSVTSFQPSSNRISEISFSPDGTNVLVGSGDHAIQLFTANGSIEKEYKGIEGSVVALAFSPNGMKIYTSENKLAQSDKYSGALLNESGENALRQWSREGELLKTSKGKSRRITSVASSPNGTILFISYSDSSASLFTGTGSFIKVFGRYNSVIAASAFSPDGTKLFTCSADSIARLWSTEGTLLMNFSTPAGIVRSAVYSPNGKEILTVSSDDIVRLWNEDGFLKETYYGFDSKHAGYYKRKVQSAAFSPDGIKVLTSLNDNHGFFHHVSLWSAKGKLLHEFPWLESELKSLYFSQFDFTALRFSPDGKKILAALDSHIGVTGAVLWSENGHVLKEYTGSKSDFNAIAFSPDGSKILSGSSDGTLQIWETMMTLEEFLKSGRIDELTPEQKKELGIK